MRQITSHIEQLLKKRSITTPNFGPLYGHTRELDWPEAHPILTPQLPPCLYPKCVRLSLSCRAEGNTCVLFAAPQITAHFHPWSAPPTELSFKKVPLSQQGKVVSSASWFWYAYNVHFLIWFDIAHIVLVFNFFGRTSNQSRPGQGTFELFYW